MSSMARRLHALRAPVAPAPMPKRLAGPGSGPVQAFAPPGAGERLDDPVRGSMERAFGHDFSSVRIHRDPETAGVARVMGAEAFASGLHIGFARGRYEPATGAGRNLLAHELAHVVQQCGTGSGRRAGGSSALEGEADRAAEAVARGAAVPPLSAAPAQIQHRIEFRDVGRGEASGFARRQEIVDRLTRLSGNLTFSLGAGGVLQYVVRPAGTASEFDRQMRVLIDEQDVTIPLRLTNRRGAVRNSRTGPFNILVAADDWGTGYVDVDDMLESDDLAFQSTFLHFLAERRATSNYNRRIGTETFSDAEFDRVHARGIDAEVLFMRDFFGDPLIEHDRGRPGDVIVQFRTGRPAGAQRRDIIRMHMTRNLRGEQRGLNRMTVDVLLADGGVMTAAAYRALRLRERAAAAAPAAPGAAAAPAGGGAP